MAYDLNKLKEKYTKLNTKKQPSPFENTFKIQAGSNFIRILPSADDPNAPDIVDIPQHVLRFGQDLKYIQCLKAHNEECPVCQAYFHIWDMVKAGDKSLEHLGKGSTSIKAKTRYFFNILDRRDNKVKVFSCPEKLFGIIMAYVFGNEEKGIDPVENFFDLEKGYDFNIIGSMQGEYMTHDQSVPKMKPSPLAASKKEIDEILSQRSDLTKLVRKEDYSEVKILVQNLFVNATTPTKSQEKEPNPPALSDEDFAAKLNSKVQ
jgi:hypothetical protein